MNYGTEAQRVRAQVAHDNREPEYETDAEQALREWLAACPAKLSGFQEADILKIAGRGW